jgi:hypothetical protein
MSAFSDWNGPGCGGGASLPSVHTLQELILEVGKLDMALASVRDRLQHHLTQSDLGDLHTALQDDYKTRILALETSLLASSGPIAQALTDAKAYVDQRLGNLAQGTVAATIQAEATLRAQADTVLDNRITALDAKLLQEIADVMVIINALEQTLSTRLLSVDEIKAYTGINIKVRSIIDGTYAFLTLLARDYIDFRNMKLVHGQVVPITNLSAPGVPNVVTLVAVLSDIWDETQPGKFPGVDNQKHKPARAYIKFINTKPWNAIIDMAATINQDNPVPPGDKYSATLSGLCAKGIGRKELTFGLYHGTNKDGHEYIYLGIITEDTAGLQFGSTIHNLVTGQEYYIAGVNLLPLDEAHLVNYSNAGVTEISRIEFRDGEGWIFDKLTVSKWIRANNYLDLAGGGVAVTDEQLNTLTIGEPNPSATPEQPYQMRQLEIYSTDRPEVTHQDYSRHALAYLTDLSQSIYWQRAVTIVTEDLTELEDLVVYVDASGNIVSPPTAGATAVPGYYTVDPTSAYPAGIIFDDVNEPVTALVKDSGSKSGPLPDGRLNDVIPSSPITGTDFDISKVTGTEKIVVGTTVIDQDDNYGEVVAIGPILPGQPQQITIKPIASTDTSLFEYTLPAYYTYDKSTDTWGNPIIIPVPETFDQYIHDITYQWSGASAPQDRVSVDDYYVPSYLTWTPHHEDIVQYPEFHGDAWSFTDIPMDGYRSAARQDEIDNHLELLASMQPDYAEREPTLVWSRPEQPDAKIANPAYIQHRPWTGIALLDSGSFIEPHIYETWVVDGGDFTGMGGAVASALATPAVPANQQWRNVIFRLWRGLYTDMPELNVLQPDATAVWNNFAHTFRWAQWENPSGILQPNSELYVSESGTKLLHRFIPFSSYKNGTTIMQGGDGTLDTTNNQFDILFRWTDFVVKGYPAAGSLIFSYKSDKGTALWASDLTEPWTITFTQTNAQELIFTSPRILRLEQSAVFKINANYNIVQALDLTVNTQPEASFDITKILDNITADHTAGSTTTTIVTTIESDANSGGDETLLFEVTAPSTTSRTIVISSPRFVAAEGRLTALETRATALEGRMDDAEDRLDTIENTTIPAAIATANAYTDTEIATEVTRANAYTDAAIAAEVTRADAYADNAETSAKAYTDTEIATEVTRADAYADNAAATAETNAQTYTDNKVADLAGIIGTGATIPAPPTTGPAVTLTYNPGTNTFTWV